MVALVLVPLLGFPTGVNTVLFGLSLVGGPELLMLAAVAVLGKAGVEALMSKLGSFGKRLLRWDSVTKIRYMIGLLVLAASMLAPLVPLFVWEHSIATIDGGPGWGFYLAVASVFVFIGAVLSKGAPLWARIEAIVTWEAAIVLPEPDE